MGSPKTNKMAQKFLHRKAKREVGEKDLKRDNVTNDKAIIDGNSNEARIGRETTRTRLLVRFGELHYQSFT